MKANQSATAGIALSAIATLFSTNQGRVITELNPKPPAEGPIDYVVLKLSDSTAKIQKSLGGGEAEFLILAKKNADGTIDENSVVKMHPNVALKLFKADDGEADGYKLGAPIEQTAGEPTAEDQAALNAELAGEQGKEGTKPVDAAADAEKKAKKEAAEKKAAEKKAAKDKREADAAAAKAKKDAEAAERAKKQEAKKMSSGKIAALRTYRSIPQTDPSGANATHRSRVMAIFRAPEKDGGMGWSTQHANTYYQNCKGIWKDEVLPEAPAKAAE